MISRRRFIALAAGGALVAGGAAAGATLLPGERPRSGPPDLRYGAEQCTYCGMVISEPRFAAAWRDASGRERHFDDIGCMVNAARRGDPGAGTEWWVHDYTSLAWLDAGTAVYVFSDTIKTPMAYGVAAFARVADANVPSGAAPAVRTWDEARRTVERKG